MAASMEVDVAQSNVMASTATSGSVSISLHPLVIMNVSEHWTRVKAQEGKIMQGRPRARRMELSLCSHSRLCVPDSKIMYTGPVVVQFF